MEPAAQILSKSTIYEPTSYKLDYSRVFLGPGEKIDESLLCGICQEVPFKPEECSVCQNLFCSGCIRAWIEKKAKCPYNCPEPFQASRPHKLIRQALSAIKYTCINKENGCEEIIVMESIDKHEGRCPFAKIKCPVSTQCGEEMLRKEVENHEKVCEFFLIKCEKCEFSLFRNIFPNHDCVLFLRDKLAVLEKAFEDFKLANDKTIELLVKKVGELEVQLQGFEKGAARKNVHDKICQRGHLLEWGRGVDIKECDLCKKNNVFSRFSCPECGLKYCVWCIYPYLASLKCPVGHELAKSSKLVWHSCDLCRKDVGKESEVYRDVTCDFDCCRDCFVKACK